MLDLRFTISGIPFPTSISSFLYKVYLFFRYIEILNPIPRFSRIVFAVRHPLYYIGYPLSNIDIPFPIPSLPFAMSDTKSYTEIFSYRVWPTLHYIGYPFSNVDIPFLYRVYLSLYRDTDSHTEISSYQDWKYFFLAIITWKQNCFISLVFHNSCHWTVLFSDDMTDIIHVLSVKIYPRLLQ